MSTLLITNLHSYYGDYKALFGIDAHIDEGQCVSFIGANGAGKSTLMNSITGLVRRKTGSIIFKGKELITTSAAQIVSKGISIVPEGRKLFTSLSVEENLLIGQYLKKSGYWDLSCLYTLFPILKEKKDMPISSLSGGQQQMVAIGRALMSNPKLLLCDELSLGLAPIIIKDIYKALQVVIKEGTSIVIVEQDITRALDFSDYVYCITEGKISLEGQTDTISLADIKNAYFGITEEGN